MINTLLGNHCSQAHLQDNKLILNFSDAETPVVWVIDLQSNPTILLKVEAAENGLHVLQKITPSNGNNTTEDLAYYKKRGHAIKAMDKTTHALNRSPRRTNTMKKLVTFALSVAVIAILIAYWPRVTAYMSAMTFLTNALEEQSQSPAPEQTAESKIKPQQIEPSNNPEAVGVPLSADDFLNARRPNKSRSPF